MVFGSYLRLGKRRSSDFSKAFVVQGHRFDIYEEVGCFPATYNTLPAYFLVHMWPVVLGLCSGWFCGGFLWFRLVVRSLTPL